MKNRLSNYPKGSKLIKCVHVINCALVEQPIIAHFNNKFIKRRDIGNEYYEGDIGLITKEFEKICILFTCKNDDIAQYKINNIYTCDDCRYVTKISTSFRKHINSSIHIDSLIDIHICDNCNYMTKTLSHLKKHVDNEHVDLSDENTSTEYDTSSDIDNNSIVINPKYMCDDCNYSTNILSNFKIHIDKCMKCYDKYDIIENNKYGNNYICTVCKYTTKISTNFKKHINTDQHIKSVVRYETKKRNRKYNKFLKMENL